MNRTLINADIRSDVRPTLRMVINRVHLKVALLAVNLAGVSLTLLGLLALGVYAEQNQKLIARSISYTTEAAVVFDDKAAASEALSLIASTEDVANALVLNARGEVMAQWARPADDLISMLELRVARLLLSKPLTLPIIHQNQQIGSVLVTSNGANLLQFLISGFGGILGCLALTAFTAQYLSKGLLRGITRPLKNLAAAAHAAREDRTFDLRVPEAAIEELNNLSNDFNALLGELEEWRTHVKHENRRLAHQATHDSLTGLPNRAFFEGRLKRAVRNAQEQGEHIAVLFLDSDRFKNINDTYGHAAGDTVLVTVAARIQAQLREHDLVARLGGDEFAVMLTPIRSVDDAVRIADGVIASMDAPIEISEGVFVSTTLSVGIAFYPDHALSPDKLVKAADAAMYHAKRAERGSRHIALPAKDGLDL